MCWTQQQLTELCDRKNISREFYSFCSDKDEAYCLDKIKNEWLIYYLERGRRNELAWAKNEAQALKILKLFLLDENKTR